MNTLECIKTRHSTRKFKSEPVAQELLDTVIDAGRRAPTGGQFTAYTFYSHYQSGCVERTSNPCPRRVWQDGSNGTNAAIHGEHH